MAFLCVSIYLVDKAWGGPEEGGWWYDAGEPALEYASHTRIFSIEGRALAYRDMLRSGLVAQLNEGRREINSVLSEGRYEAVIDEDHYPEPYPKERPHYE